MRIMSEMSVSDVSFFSLISYNEENLPDPDLPDKRAIQLLVKRLRSRLVRDYWRGPDSGHFKPSLKYFIVSEYGEERNRLHYHAIFFLRNVDDSTMNRFIWKELLEDTWQKGFCSAFYLTQKEAKYCCKYIQKDYNMMLHSRIGAEAYVYNNMDFQPDFSSADPSKWKLPTFPMNGRNFLAPRLWRDKLIEDIFEFNPMSFYGRRMDEIKVSKLTPEDKTLINEKHLIDNPNLVRDREEMYSSYKFDDLKTDEF